MEIVKVEAYPLGSMRSGGVNYEAGDKIEVVGQDQIGMMSPRPQKYLALKNFDGKQPEPVECWLADHDEWKKATADEVDAAVTKFRKQETARKRKDQEAAEAQANADAAVKAAAQSKPKDQPAAQTGE